MVGTISNVRRLVLAAALLSALPASAYAEEASLPHAVKIGVLNDRSGAYADAAGEGSAVAARLAADEFGNKILGAPIEIIVGDHTGKADLGVGIARKWFDDENVDAIADIANSGVGLAVVGLAKERNKVVLNNSASSDFTGKACAPTAVQWSYNSYANANALSAALKRAGFDSIFTIAVDYAYGHALAADLKRFVENSGGKVVGSAQHPLNTADFSSYLLQAQGSGAKAVALADSGADLVNILKQADEFRIAKQQAIVVVASINLSEIEALGLPISQGLLTMSAFEWAKTDEFAPLDEAFRRKDRQISDRRPGGHLFRGQTLSEGGRRGAFARCGRRDRENAGIACRGRLRDQRAFARGRADDPRPLSRSREDARRIQRKRRLFRHRAGDSGRRGLPDAGAKRLSVAEKIGRPQKTSEQMPQGMRRP